MHSSCDIQIKQNKLILTYYDLRIHKFCKALHCPLLFFRGGGGGYSFHTRLNSHYDAWSYKKNKHKKIIDMLFPG